MFQYLQLVEAPTISLSLFLTGKSQSKESERVCLRGVFPRSNNDPVTLCVYSWSLRGNQQTPYNGTKCSIFAFESKMFLFQVTEAQTVRHVETKAQEAAEWRHEGHMRTSCARE